jgi:predicted DNA-binding protein
MLVGKERLRLLGITPDNCTVRGWFGTETAGGESNGKIMDYPLFAAKDNGDIEITFCQPNGDVVLVDGKKATVPYVKTRLAAPKKGGAKYLQPKASPQPWYPPHVVRRYVQATAGDAAGYLDTLILVEGEFKAMRGALAGLNIVAIPGIHNIKESDQARGDLFITLKSVIEICRVREIVILFDADCVQFPGDFGTKWDPKSQDPEAKFKDLSKRPIAFYTAVRNLREGIGNLKKDIKTTFAYLAQHAARTDPKNTRGPHPELVGGIGGLTSEAQALETALQEPPKGLDDLLLHYPDYTIDIVGELLDTKRKEYRWMVVQDVTAGGPVSNKEIKNWFGIDSPANFYQKYQDKIKLEEFNFRGSRYRWEQDNENGGQLVVVKHQHQDAFINVGGNIMLLKRLPTALSREMAEMGIKVDRMDQLEYQALPERYIKQFYKKHDPDFLSKIPMYHSFTTVPENQRRKYQRVIETDMGPMWNMWEPPVWEPKPLPAAKATIQEACPTIWGYFEHAFRNQYQDVLELMLDWVTLKWRKPTQKLPMIALVSEAQGTGKSTFGELIKLMFGDNAVMAGNDAIADKFNSDWISKGVVIVNEAFSDSDTVMQKLKTLSTDSTYQMEMKHGTRQQIEIHLAFIFTSNKELYFMPLEREDTRFLVCKLPVLQKSDPDMRKKFVEEMPYWIHWIEQRPLTYPREDRLWFSRHLLDTKAKRAVIQAVRPNNEAILEDIIIDEFERTRLEDLYFTSELFVQRIKEGQYQSISKNKISKVLEASFGILQKNGPYSIHYDPAGNGGQNDHPYGQWAYEPVRKVGRHYHIRRISFLTDDRWLAHLQAVHNELASNPYNNITKRDIKQWLLAKAEYLAEVAAAADPGDDPVYGQVAPF